MYWNLKYIEALACNHHEKNCDEFVKHTFPGGKYNQSKYNFDRIEEIYNDLIKKERLRL